MRLRRFIRWLREPEPVTRWTYILDRGALLAVAIIIVIEWFA